MTVLIPTEAPSGGGRPGVTVHPAAPGTPTHPLLLGQLPLLWGAVSTTPQSDLTAMPCPVVVLPSPDLNCMFKSVPLQEFMSSLRSGPGSHVFGVPSLKHKAWYKVSTEQMLIE